MSNPTYTLQDLENLKRAVATGTLRVRVGDRETEYRSIAELKKALDIVELELGLRQRGPIMIEMTPART